MQPDIVKRRAHERLCGLPVRTAGDDQHIHVHPPSIRQPSAKRQAAVVASLNRPDMPHSARSPALASRRSARQPPDEGFAQMIPSVGQIDGGSLC